MFVGHWHCMGTVIATAETAWKVESIRGLSEQSIYLPIFPLICPLKFMGGSLYICVFSLFSHIFISLSTSFVPRVHRSPYPITTAGTEETSLCTIIATIFLLALANLRSRRTCMSQVPLSPSFFIFICSHTPFHRARIAGSILVSTIISKGNHFNFNRAEVDLNPYSNPVPFPKVPPSHSCNS